MNVFSRAVRLIVDYSLLLIAEAETGAHRDTLEPVAIGRLERFVGDMAVREGWVNLPYIEPSGFRVGIVGSGPAGMACAADMAKAGNICVAEVEEIVEAGEIDPDHVHLPGIYVDRIVVNATPEKRIEQRTTREGVK